MNMIGFLGRCNKNFYTSVIKQFQGGTRIVEDAAGKGGGNDDLDIGNN